MYLYISITTVNSAHFEINPILTRCFYYRNMGFSKILGGLEVQS